MQKPTFMRITQYIEAGRKVPTIPSTESWVTFKGSNGVSSFQPYMLAQLLKNKDYENLISPQEAVIIDMYDSELDVPVRRLKMYYKGHITTKPDPSGDEISLEAKKYYFKFVQISRASEPIPAPPKEFNFNQKLSLWTHAPLKQIVSLNK